MARLLFALPWLAAAGLASHALEQPTPAQSLTAEGRMPPSASVGDAEVDIREIILKRAEAMRRHDAAALTEGLSPAAVVVEMVGSLRLPPDAASDTASVRGWLASWAELRDLRVHVSGGVAVAYSLNRLKGRRTDGRYVDMWMRSMLALTGQTDG
jgi:ketosteroid isomerase-like protein